MFTLGVPEMVVIFILALVLFGPRKLPELGRTIGNALTEFRRASNDLKATFEREMHTLEQENKAIRQTTSKVTGDLKKSLTAPLDPLKQGISIDDPEGASATSGTRSSNGTQASKSAAQSQPVESASSEAANAQPADPVQEPVQKKQPAIQGTVPRGSKNASAELPPDEPSAEETASPEATQNA